MTYLVIKAIHVVAIISWMAGLLYLPRLFVYHAATAIGSIQSETFKIMERRLFRAIMYPAMTAGWASGIYLMVDGHWYLASWFHVKATAVILITAVHFWLGQFVASFGVDVRKKPARFFRIINEVPTVLMILIVVMVIVKPF